MAAPTPIVHVFNEINIGRFKSVKHYETTETTGGKTLLSETINISKDMGFAKSLPDYWLKERQGAKWASERTTGLFYTGVPMVYYGDINNRRHLVLFKFSNEARTLTIYQYSNYYTKELTTLIRQIQNITA
jgi:hypothetical protein